MPRSNLTVTLVRRLEEAQGSILASVLRDLPGNTGPVIPLGQTCFEACQRQSCADRQTLLVWLDRELGDAPVDRAVLRSQSAPRRLLLCDMDSSIIEQECMDELAVYAGVGEEVATLTDKAMRGEIGFVEALVQRLALLEGLPLATLEACYQERIRLRPGARELVMTMKALGGRSILVTGGFDLFAGKIADLCGFDSFYANRLAHDGEVLLGRVEPPVLDSAAKLDTLKQETVRMGLALSETLCIGDGANDIPMLQAAGLGISLFGKPQVSLKADAKISHTGLMAALFFQGIPETRFVGQTRHTS